MTIKSRKNDNKIKNLTINWQKINQIDTKFEFEFEE